VTDASGSQHRQSWDLIPWIINGTASEPERRVVEEHLNGCVDCRQELEFQRRLQRAVAHEGNLDSDAESSWARLSERLDAESEAAPAARPRRVGRADRRWMQWVMAAMLVQGVGLGVLGTALWSRASSGSLNAPATSGAYRVLSSSLPASQPATVRVVFAPTMSLGELSTILANAHLQVVSGPSDADVWSLGPAGESTRSATDAAVRTLRSSSNVRFAEPIGTPP
jgi:predicted anti-sigma-YlaC factor YlaD